MSLFNRKERNDRKETWSIAPESRCVSCISKASFALLSQTLFYSRDSISPFTIHHLTPSSNFT
jgi:hypothetical protein